MRQPDFPKLYSLRASEEVCPKHRKVHREIPVAAQGRPAILILDLRLTIYALMKIAAYQAIRTSKIVNQNKGAWQKSDAPALQAGQSGSVTRRPPPISITIYDLCTD